MRIDNGINIGWEEVHAITHGLHDNPHHLLGAHMGENGVIINAYVKDALKVEVKHRDSKVSYEMRASGIADFFTLVTDEKAIFPYSLKATYRDGSTYEYVDGYSFEPVIDNIETTTYSQGINYEAYKLLGAHKMKLDEVDGVLFAVWAPNAQRVSVVGDFNLWDGTRGLMRRLPNSCIFELFIPGIDTEARYRYQIRTHRGELLEKKDPVSFANIYDEAGESVVADLTFRFRDGKWMKKRDANALVKQPLNIYQLSFEDWMEEDKEFDLRAVTDEICQKVKELGYTHIECAPIMDGIYADNGDFLTNGFYAVQAKYGTPADFMYFVDYMHRNEIGVILDWSPAWFTQDDMGLRYFDTAPVYEDENILRATSPLGDRMYFNYGRTEVSNYLIANAMYWVESYHVDGLCVKDVGSMLYLDYGRQEGEWLPNIYGSNENLDAMEFMKHLNSMMKKRNPGVIMIAEDDSLYPGITKSLEDEGMGFDYKWNKGWSEDFLQYISADVAERKREYNNLTMSLLYAYNENYMYGFGAEQMKENALTDRIAGSEEHKNANAKVAIAYLMTQPGKKYIYEANNRVNDEYLKDLNALYVAEPALWKNDYEQEGFEWINVISAMDGIVVYTRKTDKKDDTMLFVCNFSDEVKTNYMIGVPYEGKYKEVLCSDSVKYGGEGNCNPRMRQSKNIPCDARKNSIQITVPAFGCSIFKYNTPGISQTIKKTAESTKNRQNETLKTKAKVAEKEVKTTTKRRKK